MAHNQCIVTGPVGSAGTTYTDVHFAAGNALEATVTGSLVYGSGGTSIRIRLEGSFDGGLTWFPVGDMGLGTATASKTFIVRSESADAFDPATVLASNTIRRVLPYRLRVATTITGTYAASTLDVWVAIKDSRQGLVMIRDIDGGTYGNEPYSPGSGDMWPYPDQAGNEGRVLGTDGSAPAWVEPSATDQLYRWKAGRWYTMQQVVPADWGGTETLTADQIYATPLYVPVGSGAIDRVGIAVNTGKAGSTTRLMYYWQGADGLPGDLAHDFGTVSTNGSGDLSISGNWELPAGAGWLAAVADDAITVNTFTTPYLALTGAALQAGNDSAPNRANGGIVAPDPFGSAGLTFLSGKYLRLAVRAA